MSPSLLDLFHRGAAVLLLHALIAFWRLRIAVNQWRLARIMRRLERKEGFPQGWLLQPGNAERYSRGLRERRSCEVRAGP